jgi:hypothetical protein
MTSWIGLAQMVTEAVSKPGGLAAKDGAAGGGKKSHVTGTLRGDEQADGGRT